MTRNKVVSVLMCVVFLINIMSINCFAEPVNNSSIESTAQLYFNYKNTMIQEHNSGNYSNTSANSEIPKLRILFVRCNTLNGQTLDTIDNGIYARMIPQFESFVESFSNYKVDVVVEQRIIGSVVTSNEFVDYFDIQTELDRLAPFGTYDSVIVLGKDGVLSGNPITTINAFDKNTGFGYTYCPISLIDRSIDWENCNHLYTTEIVLHEWLHQLEAFLLVEGFDFPCVHGYLESRSRMNNSSEYDNSATDGCSYEIIFGQSKDNLLNGIEPLIDYNEISNTGGRYEWDITVSTGIEPVLTSYYKAMLDGTLRESSHKVGMCPTAWQFFNCSTMFGRYYMQNSNNYYKYLHNNAILLSDNVINNDEYKWDIALKFPEGFNVVI